MGTNVLLLIPVRFLGELLDSSLGMLYGTILSPVLIIAGYDPLVVVPSILITQALSGFVAAIGHH
ncbi:MAG TPA: sulfite exporter TauE/SafE family protein, partial [Candidatus Acetothermia bacterium]|nr:sulfite exporter TauE/SafE family protein [Candidatus Acetothermia bacterium]